MLETGLDADEEPQPGADHREHRSTREGGEPAEPIHHQPHQRGEKPAALPPVLSTPVAAEVYGPAAYVVADQNAPSVNCVKPKHSDSTMTAAYGFTACAPAAGKDGHQDEPVIAATGSPISIRSAGTADRR